MIPVSIPYVASNQKKYVNDCLDRNWISAFGKYDKLLCEGFSSYVGTKFGSTCSNGTVALHLALLACGVKPGDEVILPNFNGPYALFSVGYVGAKPVLIDIDDNWDISLKSLKISVNKKTKAIIIPHLYGIPSKINPLKTFCKDNNIFIIEDCAEAHGAKEGNAIVGSNGDISCFSFYANKILASGEGGICLTSNKDLYDKINYYKNQTFNSGPIKTFIHHHVGHNYRMSDIHCAIAYSHFEEIEYILKMRENIKNKYISYLPEYSDFFQMKKSGVSNVNWVTTFELPEKLLSKRDGLEKFLLENNIQSRKFFAPMNEQPIFREMKGKVIGDLNNSVKISKRGIYLPTFIGIEDESIYKICNHLKNFLKKNNV